MAEDAGLKTAVELARSVRQGEDVRLSAEQLPLLPVAEAGAAAENIDPPSRGPGRPRGSVNRRTAGMREHLLNRYRSPLEVLAETYSRPVKVLAAELGCDVVEAFKLQMMAARELAPYLHSRMPQKIEVDGDALPTLTIIMQNQVLSGAGNAQLEGTVLEGLDQVVDLSEEICDRPADFGSAGKGDR